MALSRGEKQTLDNLGYIPMQPVTQEHIDYLASDECPRSEQEKQFILKKFGLPKTLEIEKGQKLWINLKGKPMLVEISEIVGTTIHFKDGFEPMGTPPKAEIPSTITGNCKNCGQYAQLTPTGLSGFNLCNSCYKKYLNGI